MADKKRILISYATAGAGHRKAAFAVKKALEELGAEDDVEIIDSLDYTNAFFRWFYPRIYIFLVNRTPLLWGIGYYLLDNRFFYGLISWMRHFTNWVNTRRLAAYLAEKDYDVIISTHFLLPDVVNMEGKNRIRSHLISVITDFRSHSFWIANAVDTYIVAHERTKHDLMSRYGIAEDKIKVSGIPIDPLFSGHKEKEETARDIGIKTGPFTVLIGSGGFGVGPIVELVKSFKGIEIPMQLLVVCGKNESLFSEVNGLSGYIGISLKVYKFIGNMDELMEVSDVIVTKTGGMMSSESLSKDLPIIAIRSIPGQETRNFKVLLESGVILEAREIKDVPRIVKELYMDKGLMVSIKERIKAVKRPEAAYSVARFALEHKR
jgi:processive 1,2-diacylglycerol beta-glucosyltransferase